MKKTLIFEGAGWDKAENNGVGNCRIRTRIKNKDSRIIYFEMNGHENRTKDFIGYVNHCFDVVDERTNQTPELAYIEKMQIRYTKKNILDLINKNLNCDFDTLKVINAGLNVHNTKEPLCSCGVE